MSDPTPITEIRPTGESARASARAERRLTIAVVGVGNIGGAIAVALTAAGLHQVTGCARRPLDHLVLERGSELIETPLTILTEPEEARLVDWVLLCTKVHESASAAPWLQRLCGPGTSVAVIQNGIEHARRVADFAAADEIVPAVVYLNSERPAPDRIRIRQATEYDLIVPDSGSGHRFAALFQQTCLRVAVSANFEALMWRKLLINAIANPITALTRQRQSVFRQTEVQDLCRAILSEVVEVARSCSVSLKRQDAEDSLSLLLNYPPEAATSMYFDVLSERTLEIEALTGAIVGLAEQGDVAVPVNRTLLTLLRAINAQREHPSESAESRAGFS